MSALIYELGARSKSFYQMSDASIWKLHNKLKENIGKKECNVSKRSRKKHRQNFISNGVVCSSVRSIIALRSFIGGDPLSLALVHGMSHSEVNYSTWRVVDAIHSEKSQTIKFPAKYEEQRRVTNVFKSISTPEFDNCAECIDDFRVWTLRPN